MICITETRLYEEKPLANISIDGYEFVHTPTKTQCGGAAIFIKTGIEYEILNNLTLSLENMSESVFIEIKNEKKKNLVIGCIYRHHTPVAEFLDTYLKNTLHSLMKSKNTCAVLGDFNIDLIKYGECQMSDRFYDQLSSYGFRPLILQPTRISPNSSTLIENIFMNNQ